MNINMHDVNYSRIRFGSGAPQVTNKARITVDKRIDATIIDNILFSKLDTAISNFKIKLKCI